MVTNRNEIESLIYNVFDALDPTGMNTDRYKNEFSEMDDNEFEKFMKNFLKDPNENFVLDIAEFENDLNMDNIEKAAKILDVPLMEYVYMPHLSMDKSNIVVSKEKCLVGYMTVKRTQQLLHKKNGISISNDRVSALTGQVTQDDKNSRDSDIEASLLVALEADAILQELHGPRSDDSVMKREMQKSIASTGYVLLEDLPNVSTNKVTLNSINTFLLGMMLKSDLVSDSYILPKLSNELFGDE